MGTGQCGRKRKQARKYVTDLQYYSQLYIILFLKEIELPQEQDVMVPTYSVDMTTPPTDPEDITSKELLDGVVEHLHAVLNVQQAYEQRLTKLQQNNEEVKSLLHELQGKIEENEKDSEKSEAQATTLEYYKNEEARLCEKGKKYRERLYQRFQEDEGETLRKKLVSLEERNRKLQQELKDQTQLVAQFKKKSAMTTKNDEKDRHIKMLTDETEELRQQIELLQQQLENEDLHMNMEEEPDSEATQSDGQHTERGIIIIAYHAYAPFQICMKLSCTTIHNIMKRWGQTRNNPI